MAMNYECLGIDTEMQERRYAVLKHFLKGFTPREIAKATGLTIKKVYNDLLFLRTNQLHDVPIEMIRDFGKSFYELKIRELEDSLDGLKSMPNAWLGAQKLIKEMKVESLKIQGGYIDRVEHSGKVDSEVVHIYLPGNGRDVLPDATDDTTAGDAP